MRRLFRPTGWEWVFGLRCLKVMERADHYRDRANHARKLADAAWQLDLKDVLRGLAKDYDEVADDIENGATEIRHAETPGRVIACLSVDLCK
jgi:hypothetical protein